MPKRWRKGPASLVATSPPIVVPGNGLSTASHCPLRAEVGVEIGQPDAGSDRGRQIAVPVQERRDQPGR